MMNWTPWMALAFSLSLMGCGGGVDAADATSTPGASAEPADTSGGERDARPSVDFSIVAPEACETTEVEPGIYLVRARPFEWTVALGEAAEVDCAGDRVTVDVEPGFRLVFVTMDPSRSRRDAEALARSMVDDAAEAILGIAPVEEIPRLSLGARGRAGVCRSVDHAVDEMAMRTGICATWIEAEGGNAYLAFASITDAPSGWDSAPNGLEGLAGSVFDNWTFAAR